MLFVPTSARHAVIALALFVAVPLSLAAQSETERGENAWKAATAFALQGQIDSSLSAFAQARAIAAAVHDSGLLAASLRGAAEVNAVYRGCRDTSLALLRNAMAVSIPGDRAAGQVYVRQLSAAGMTAEARTAHRALYADLPDMPRTISRESIGYLSGLAAIQRAAGQQAAALSSLQSARNIADRLASGDAIDSTVAHSLTEITSVNYWVTFDLAQLRLISKTRGVMELAEGKQLMDAVARATDEPEEGNEHRFRVFRLADRLVVNAWRCELNGEKCPVPAPARCP